MCTSMLKDITTVKVIRHKDLDPKGKDNSFGLKKIRDVISYSIYESSRQPFAIKHFEQRCYLMLLYIFARLQENL